MKKLSLLLGMLCALLISVRAQVVELRATINQAQEAPPTGALGTGTAVSWSGRYGLPAGLS